jgi:RNA polymerase sigma-70 factor (ECF subfamily)
LSENDPSIIDRCRRGDQAAWRELVESHARAVFGICYRFVGRGDVAEDLTQETFARVYLQLDRYREDEGVFGAWLATVARNLAIDHWRRQRQERERAVEPSVMERVPDDEGGPHRLAVRSERARLVHRGLRGLTPELRLPLVLRDLAGLSYDEIARTLAVPQGTVKSRISRARLELARRLVGLGGVALAVD